MTALAPIFSSYTPGFYTSRLAAIALVAANDNKPRHDLPPVIALSGPAGSGKSTVSAYLASRHGYKLTKFAGPLKNMCRAIGLDDRHIEGDLKEEPLEELAGHTPRHAMQTLGEAWGRKCIGEDFWVDLWRQSAMKLDLVVVDDCRYPNEAAAVRRMGGRILRLAGRGGISGKHASEAQDFIADHIISNSDSIKDLHERVDRTLEEWSSR